MASVLTDGLRSPSRLCGLSMSLPLLDRSVLLSWRLGLVLKQPALLTSQNHPKHTGAKGCKQAL